MQGAGPVSEQQQARAVERLNPAVQQQLNLESVKTRAISLYKAISRILEEFEVMSRTNAVPKWQDTLGQFSMVNLELFNIVEDIKKVSKAFVVHPKNVNAVNAGVLPVMLSSKLLPEMEMDDNLKKEQLLLGMQHLPVSVQIDKLKARISMIEDACVSAEKVIADTRKAYFGTRQGPTLLPTLDKAQAAKIQEQENLLRQAVNNGEGLRIPADQRQITSSLPAHLVDILGDTAHNFADPSGLYMKNTPPLASNSNSNQAALLQASGHMGRAAASPGGAASSSHETASPLPYANSPRSGATMMNTPSPQQQQQQQQQLQQQQQQLQQQQRQKMMQLPQQQQQQLLAAQQMRQASMNGMGQAQQGQLHDLQSQSPQKFQQLHGQHHMQFSPSLGASQYQGRQLTSGAIQHGLGQTQINQGNQLNRHLNQYSNAANSALFSAAQMTPTSQMIPNMSTMMQQQSLLPRSQYGMGGGSRNLVSQNLSDQIYSMGATNPGSMMSIQQQQQQQQHISQGAYGNMTQNMQNLQSNMMPLQNTVQNQNQNQNQNHPNFQQQRPQN